MKCVLFVFLFMLGFAGNSQGLDTPNLSSGMALFSAPNTTLSLSAYTQEYTFSKFKLPEVDVFQQDQNMNQEKINMLGMAQQAELEKQRNISNMQFPHKQLNQIRSSVQVFYGNQANFNYKTGNNLNFSGNGRTPDGGIKNEVYQDITQPFISPYGFYNRGNYYPQRRSSNDNRVHFYIQGQ